MEDVSDMHRCRLWDRKPQSNYLPISPNPKLGGALGVFFFDFFVVA